MENNFKVVEQNKLKAAFEKARTIARDCFKSLFCDKSKKVDHDLFDKGVKILEDGRSGLVALWSDGKCEEIDWHWEPINKVPR